MAQDLHLVIKLFAAAREATGAEELSLRLGAGAKVGEVLDLLCEQHTRLAPRRGALRLAVNQTFALEEQVLVAGDEVAVIPPVGGG